MKTNPASTLWLWKKRVLQIIISTTLLTQCVDAMQALRRRGIDAGIHKSTTTCALYDMGNIQRRNLGIEIGLGMMGPISSVALSLKDRFPSKMFKRIVKNSDVSQGLIQRRSLSTQNHLSQSTEFMEKNIRFFKPLKLDELNWYSESDIPRNIPLLDLQKMSKKEKIDCFKKASEVAQCLYIKNYNIDAQETEDLINLTRLFFNQPESVKLKVTHPCHVRLRGYYGYQQQSSESVFNISNSSKGDSHVSFSWGSFDNVYPDLNFQKVWKNYFDKSYYMAKIISELIIESLEIEHNLSWADIKDGENILKIQEFIDDNETSQPYRIVPHADSSFITLLNQIPADNGYMGLEVKIEDKFIGIPAVKDTMLIHFGESMFSLSKGRLKPVIHQVVSPRKNFEGSSRLSIPFFLQPNPETKIYPFEASTFKKYYNSDGPTIFSDFMQNALSDFNK